MGSGPRKGKKTKIKIKNKDPIQVFLSSLCFDTFQSYNYFSFISAAPQWERRPPFFEVSANSRGLILIYTCVYFYTFLFLLLLFVVVVVAISWAASAAYGGSQARG